jgi:hypothetical protein
MHSSLDQAMDETKTIEDLEKRGQKRMRQPRLRRKAEIKRFRVSCRRMLISSPGARLARPPAS